MKIKRTAYKIITKSLFALEFHRKEFISYGRLYLRVYSSWV